MVKLNRFKPEKIMANNQDNEIFQEFLIESFENLSNINDEITQFEKDPTQMDLLNSIYRKVHTVKGSASFLSLKKLQSVTHASENLLDLIRAGDMQINGMIVDLLLSNFDVCSDILKILEDTGEEGDADYSQVVAKTVGIIESNTHSLEVINEDINIIENSPSGDNLTKVVEVKEVAEDKIQAPKLEVVKPLESTPKVQEVVPAAKAEEIEVKPTTKAAPVTKKKEEASKKGSDIPKAKGLADSVVKVNVQLLDKIMNVVGELVLNRNQIMQYAQTQDSSELNRLATQLDGITTELQQDVMTTRMQPVGSVLNKFERIVRDLSRQQNKKIQLNLSGQDTELDKSLIESIRDPLTHLIRNSVDHGIENPIDRIDKGKNEVGSINIKAYHEGGQVTIEIQDDGNGIHADVIRQKAIEKGVITEERAAVISDGEVLNLIFAPGFSTAEQVTSISGRGVGMDVVKSNIEKIRGTVDISSIPGEGTSFKLKIPLTLAIVPSLIVSDGGETYAIPQTNLVELVRISTESENQIEKVHNSEFFRLRERLVPIFRLSSILDGKSSQKLEEVKTSSEGSEWEEDATNIAMLNADGVMFGLIVDTILDTEEIVVKPLNQKLKDINIYAGATIMGDGRVALILDALGFYAYVSKSSTETKDLIDKHDEVTANAIDESQEYVLCKLKDDAVYAFPLCYVNRLEEFAGSRIEHSGENNLIRYRDAATPLLCLSDMFCKNENEIKKNINEVENHPTIVVQGNGGYIGLIVDEIQDIAISVENINSEICSGGGVLGTVYIDGKTITVLDIYGILDHYGFSLNKNVVSAGKKGARILLLEDSPLYQKMICELFSDYKHDFVVCSDGAIGLEAMEHQGEFDLIVSDINMPNLDGPGFMKMVRSRKNESYSEIPIVAISTDLKEADVKQGLEDGFSEYVEKNMQSDLIEVVQKLLAA